MGPPKASWAQAGRLLSLTDRRPGPSARETRRRLSGPRKRVPRSGRQSFPGPARAGRPASSFLPEGGSERDPSPPCETWPSARGCPPHTPFNLSPSPAARNGEARISPLLWEGKDPITWPSRLSSRACDAESAPLRPARLRGKAPRGRRPGSN